MADVAEKSPHPIKSGVITSSKRVKDIVQSAATAASIAIDSDSCVQDVDYKKLSRKLVADGQILSDSHRK